MLPLVHQVSPGVPQALGWNSCREQPLEVVSKEAIREPAHLQLEAADSHSSPLRQLQKSLGSLNEDS